MGSWPFQKRRDSEEFWKSWETVEEDGGLYYLRSGKTFEDVWKELRKHYTWVKTVKCDQWCFVSDVTYFIAPGKGRTTQRVTVWKRGNNRETL